MEEETWEILLRLVNDPKQLTLKNTPVIFEFDSLMTARASKIIKFANNVVAQTSNANKNQTKLFL